MVVRKSFSHKQFLNDVATKIKCLFFSNIRESAVSLVGNKHQFKLLNNITKLCRHHLLFTSLL